MTLDELIKLVEKQTGYEAAVKSQKIMHVYTRYIIMRLARKLGYGTKEIGIALCGRDHTTVISGSQEIEEVINNPKLNFRLFDMWDECMKNHALQIIELGLVSIKQIDQSINLLEKEAERINKQIEVLKSKKLQLA